MAKRFVTAVQRELADLGMAEARLDAVRRYLKHLDATIDRSILGPDDQAMARQEDRQGLGLPPPEPVVPFHALAPGPMFTVRF